MGGTWVECGDRTGFTIFQVSEPEEASAGWRLQVTRAQLNLGARVGSVYEKACPSEVCLRTNLPIDLKTLGLARQNVGQFSLVSRRSDRGWVTALDSRL